VSYSKTSTPISGTFTKELDVLRQDIDRVDNRLVQLLNERADVAQRIGQVKHQMGQKAYVPERERKLLQRLQELNQGPLPEESLRLIYKEIISASLALESPLRVAFLGPEATFTHEATKRHFGMSAQLFGKRSITEVFREVEQGSSDYGVVPIENSTEGIVNHTLDSFMQSDLCICAEVLLPVSHHLLNASGDLASVTKVYSHPQALAQCRRWLGENLPQIPLVDVSSTARAAQLAAEDSGAAAIASDMAASIYALQVAASYLEDVQGNMTRFLVLGREQTVPTGKDRTSMMFALKDAPGVLYGALAAFAQTGINMSRIESRPSQRRAWDYLFFIDIDDHVHNPEVTQAIEALTKSCEFVKVLGSYPQGQLEGKARRVP
jgi:chorismate mutase / prephenate dehydratase